MSDSLLTQFVRLLAPAGPALPLAGRLALVLADPAAYETTYADELLERGIGPGLPRQELRDVALIDALLAHDLLWEADWKEDAGSIAEGLNDVLTWQQHPGSLDADTLAARRLNGPDALDAVQAALEPLGLALVLLSLDSDSYPLTIVADAQADDIRRLAAELGFKLAVY